VVRLSRSHIRFGGLGRGSSGVIKRIVVLLEVCLK
jgi:hypothetical protein